MKNNNIPVVHAEPVIFTDLRLTKLSHEYVATANELKSSLEKSLSAEYGCVEPRLVQQAINEADALASLTVVPLLLLPALAEEKVQNAAAWSMHQRSVRGGAGGCLALAA